MLPPVQFTGGAPVDPDLEQPLTDEITVGFERQLFRDFSLAVNAFYRESDDLVDDVNISVGPSSFVPVEFPDVGLDGVPGTGDDGTLTAFNQISDFINQVQITNTVTRRQLLVGNYSIFTGLFVPSTGGWGNPREIQEPQTIRIGVRLRF